MITVLIEAREMLLKLYQKTRVVVNPVVKFILSWIVFAFINDSIGFDPRFTKTIVTLGLSAICAFTPGAVLVLCAMLLSLLHIYSVSIFMAVLLLMIFIILYGLMMRFSPKQAVAAVAIPVLAKYNLHYCVPILMGSVASPVTIMPTTCGVLIYYIMKIVKEASARQVEFDLDDVVQLYTDVFDAIIANKQMIIVAVVFALVIIAVWGLRKFSFDYSFEISIAAGVVVTIIGFLVADLKYDATVNIGTLIFMSVLSGFIAMICDYMKRILDYTAVERVQFEDDDYYYYVKAVPKVNISLKEIDIKHFNHHSRDGEDIDCEDEEDDGDAEDVTEDESPFDRLENDEKLLTRDDDDYVKAYRKSYDDEEDEKEDNGNLRYLPLNGDYDGYGSMQPDDEEDEGFVDGGFDEEPAPAVPEKRENPYMRKRNVTVEDEPGNSTRVFLNDDGDYEEDMTLDDEK